LGTWNKSSWNVSLRVWLGRACRYVGDSWVDEEQISGIIFNYMLGKQLPQVDCKLSGPTLVGSP
jgi:hypothetical protein